MAENIFSELKVRLSADLNKLKEGLRKAKKDVDKFGARAEKAWQKSKAGIAAMGVALLAFTGIFAKMGADYEREMAQVHTLTSQSREEIQQMGMDLLKVSAQTGQATRTMTKGLYDTVSAMVPVGEAISFVDLAAKSAIAGATDTATSVDALTSVVNAYRDELGENLSVTERTQRASDIFFMTIKRGKTTYAELALGIGRLTAVSAQVGVKFEGVGAALASLTRAGVQTPIAIIALRQALVAIQKPSQEAAEYAEKMGIDFSAASLEARGLGGFLAHVKEKIGDNSEAIAKLFPNVRAMTAVMGLAGKGAEGFAEDLEAMKDVVGATEDAYEKMAKTASHRFSVAKQTVVNYATSVGQGLVTAFTDLLEVEKDATGGITSFSNAMRMARQVGIAVGKVYLALKASVMEIATPFVNVAFGFQSAWTSALNYISEAYSHMVIELKKGLASALEYAETVINYYSFGSETARTLAQQAQVDSAKLRLSIQEDKHELAKANREHIKEEKKLQKEYELTADLWKQKTIDYWAAWANLGKSKGEIEKETRGIGAEVAKQQQAAQEESERQRDLKFAHEQELRRQLRETTEYYEKELDRRTGKLVDSIKDQKSELESLQDAFISIGKAQEQQGLSFQERLVSIRSAGLSEEGKAIQQGGLARFFETRAKEAFQTEDFEDSLELMKRAQNIYASLAEKGSPQAFQQFQALQREITSVYEQQKEANTEAQKNARVRIEELREEVQGLVADAEKKLEIELDTEKAQEKLAELRGHLDEIKMDLGDEGISIVREPTKQKSADQEVLNVRELLKQKSADQASSSNVTVNLNLNNAQVTPTTVRNLIIPEIQKQAKKLITLPGVFGQ